MVTNKTHTIKSNFFGEGYRCRAIISHDKYQNSVRFQIVPFQCCRLQVGQNNAEQNLFKQPQTDLRSLIMKRKQRRTIH